MTYTPHPAPAPAPAQPRSFTPVPVRPRHDGWTPERQTEFIAALAACGCVGDAAARVGMTTDGAYVLRQRGGSVSFRAAWDGALDIAVKRLSEAAFSRALHGVVRPHYYKGELVGEHRVFNESLTRFLLQHLDPAGFGPLETEMTLYNREEDKVVALADAVRDMVAEAEADIADDVGDADADEPADAADADAAAHADEATGSATAKAGVAEPAVAGVAAAVEAAPDGWLRPAGESGDAEPLETGSLADTEELGHWAWIVDVPERRAGIVTETRAGTETRACAADVSPALPVSGPVSGRDAWRTDADGWYVSDRTSVLPCFGEVARAGATAGRSDRADAGLAGRS